MNIFRSRRGPAKDQHKEALQMLKFYSKINKYKSLLETDHLVQANAIRRYEQCWLPMVRSHGWDARWLVAPLDIEFVWTSHIMMNPNGYAEDCKALGASGLIEHQFMSKSKSKPQIHRTKKIWKKWFPKEPYKAKLNPVKEVIGVAPEMTVDYDAGAFESKIKTDLRTAVLRHADFIYQIHIPHHWADGFVYDAVKKYLRILEMKKQQPELTLAMPLDVTLIWMSHLLNPQAYSSHCEKAHEDQIINHDNTFTDRSQGGALVQNELKMNEAWTSTDFKKFSMPLSRYGVLWRGDPPFGDIKPLTSRRENEILVNHDKVPGRTTTFSLSKGEWENVPIDSVPWIGVPILPEQLASGATVMTTTNKIWLRRQTLFNIRVTHSLTPAFSTLLLTDYDTQEPLASAHTIGLKELPKHSVSGLLGYLRSPGLSPSHEMRAMIVRGRHDHGILLANWKNFNNKPKVGRGDQGFLQLYYYNLRRRHWNRLCMEEHFTICGNGLEVDYFKPRIRFTRRPTHVVENITLSFACAVVHCLLQPRDDEGAFIFNEKLKKAVRAEDALMLHMAGYNVDVPSNHYLKTANLEHGLCGACGFCDFCRKMEKRRRCDPVPIYGFFSSSIGVLADVVEVVPKPPPPPEPVAAAEADENGGDEVESDAADANGVNVVVTTAN